MVTNNSSNIPTGVSGTVLQGQGAGTKLALSTATYPSVATGTGKILRADGTNWVPTTATFPDTAGASGNVLTSDGTNWSSSTPASIGSLPIGSIVYYANNDSTDLASNWLKCDGTAYAQASYATLYARLGLINDRWTNATIAISAGHASTMRSGTYGGGLYVYGQQNGYIGTSTDGITWTEQARPTSTDVNALAYGNSLYVAAGLGGTLATSPDGVTWTLRTSGTASNISALTYGNGLYVYGGVGGVLRTSTNGITWTSRTSNTTSAIMGLTYGNGVYVYVGTGNTMGTSTDGTTWTELAFANILDFSSITFGKGTFVAAGTNAALTVGYVYTSRDGTNWTNNTVFQTTIQSVVYSNNMFALGASAGFAVSDSTNLWRSFQYAISIFMAGGNGVFFTGNGAAANVRTITRGFSYNTATSFQVPSIPPIYDTTSGLKTEAYIRAT